MCINQFASPTTTTTTTTLPEVTVSLCTMTTLKNNNNAVDQQQLPAPAARRRSSHASLVSLPEEQEEEERVRAVHFAEYVTFVSSPSPLDRLNNNNNDDTITSYADLWYQASDMTLFRDEARLLCREMRRQDELEPTYNPKLLRLSSSCSTTTSSRSSSSSSSSDETTATSTANTRGFEQRSCLERQRRKYLASRFILKAAQQGACPQRLARMSQRLTAWALELAQEEARRDYARAYHPHHSQKQQRSSSSSSHCSSSKRSASLLEPERRVRARA